MSTINAGSTTPTALTLTGNTDGTLDFATGGTIRLTLTSGGNLNFAGTGQRITGDFSNATTANRLAFQTSTTNGATVVGAIPNGTSNESRFVVYSTSDPNNSSIGQVMFSGTSDFSIRSGLQGTGSNLPMTFYTGGSERVRIDSSGNVGIGTASPGVKLDVSGSVRSTAVGVSLDNGVNFNSFGDTNSLIKANSVSGAMEYYGFNGHQFITTNGGANTRVTIASSGNVAIGGTPSAWGSDTRALQIFNRTSLSDLQSTTQLTNNGYWTGSGWIYLQTAAAGNYNINGNTHIWRYAASGTAGNAITWAEAMRIDSSGNAMIGTASQYGSAKLSVAGSVVATGGWDGTNSSAGKLGGVVQSFACERSGTGASGQVMSFGNGAAAGKGLRMPFAGKVLVATLAGTGIDGTVTIDVYKNGATNTSYRLTATNVGAADVGVTQNWSSSPLTFAAGDTIGWHQTVVPTAAITYNVSFYVIFD
jgi:hypothetical protein